MRTDFTSETTIYNSVEGRERILTLYDAFRDKLGIEFEDRFVDTRFGRTHVLVNGPADGMPVVITHGGNSINPQGLLGLLPVLKSGGYRFFAPDTIGHPGRSAEVRLPAYDLSYGVWLSDLLDGLGIDTAAFIGGSFGTGIILKLAAYSPGRITKAALFVPAGIVAVPFSSMVFRIGFPYLLYLLLRTPEQFRRAVGWMGRRLDDDVLHLVDVIFRNVRIEAEMPPPVTAEELADFTAPTLIIAAENDAMFPGKKVVRRAEKIFRNLGAAECLPGATHFMSIEDTEYVNRKILDFLETEF